MGGLLGCVVMPVEEGAARIELTKDSAHGESMKVIIV
jgi:hypothetical protein